MGIDRAENAHFRANLRPSLHASRDGLFDHLLLAAFCESMPISDIYFLRYFRSSFSALGMRLRLSWLQMLGGAIVLIICLYCSTQFLSIRLRRQRFSPSRKYSVGHYHIEKAESGENLAAKEFKVDNETFQMIEKIHREQTFKRKPVITIDAKTPFFDLVVPVTGASSNHFEEFREHISTFAKLFPGIRVFFYDLGLTRSQVRFILKNLPFVQYRMFDFNEYPSHVGNLINYAWKPLIIQEILGEFDGAMWFDSSIKFKRNNTHEVLQRLARQRSGFSFFVGITGHSIVAATHPGMMEYIPIKTNDAVKDMFEANSMIVINTPEVQKHIMKWLAICSLEEDCIAPVGSELYCGFNFPKDKFGGCHRYDQSLVNILVSNVYSSDRNRYVFEGFAEVDRL